MFTGFNVAFFPMHITGLAGMPRRVYTYPAGIGWETLNMVSTVGAYTIAAGVLVFIVDLALNLRPTGGNNAGNVWNAGTLEWLPNDNYGVRSVPIVHGREPLWEQPGLSRDVDCGRYYLPNTATGGRETIVTSPVDARPQYVLQMPGPGWTPVLAAFFTAAFFLLLTVKLVTPAVVCGVLALAMVLRWLWDTDPGPSHPPVDVGGGLKLPVYMTGPRSHSWWAMVVLVMVSGSVFGSLVFSYLFLWTVSPEVWPSSDGGLPGFGWPVASAALLVSSSAGIAYASRRLKSDGHWRVRLAMVAAVLLLGASLATEFFGQWQTGLRPDETAYGAAVYAVVGLHGLFVLILGVMGLFTVARSLCGLLDARRRSTFDNTMVFWHYGVAQGLAALALLHAFPRLTG